MDNIKASLYFPLANYFKFFAKLKLLVWRPRVIVVTGSIGKTTTFEFLRSQISETQAYFAEHVNSSYGVSINILGLKANNEGALSDWIKLFFIAPFALFTKFPKQKVYIVEADTDRPREGEFLATLLRPEVTIWVSSTTTHSVNFDKLVDEGKFKTVDEAIAQEYSYFGKNTSKLVVANTDFSVLESHLNTISADIIKVSKKSYLKDYKVDEEGTEFKILDKIYKFDSILPAESYFSLVATSEVVSYLGLDFDSKFKNFLTPPSRGTILKGINNSIIIDSSYNASKDAVLAFIDLSEEIKKTSKRNLIFIFGDMRELGNEAEEEHKEVARKINKVVDELYCVGPLTREYVLPNIDKNIKTGWFRNSEELGDYLKINMTEKSLVVVKGSQNQIFLEEAIKPILKEKTDQSKLCRQSAYWLNAKKKFFSI